MVDSTAQTISVGGGLFTSNHDVFKKGRQIQFELGKKISKTVLLSCSYSYGRSPNNKEFHPIYFLSSFLQPPSDTFFNVNEVNKYSVETYLVKTRILLNANQDLNVFITPILGISMLSEAITYRSADYNNNVEYKEWYPTLGLEAGLERHLNKSKTVFASTSYCLLKIYSEDSWTDVYNPSFMSQNTFYCSLQIRLRFQFSEKFQKKQSEEETP